jgi:hypothetical protein
MKRIVTIAITFLFLTATIFSILAFLENENQNVGFILTSSVTYFNNGTKTWSLTEDDRAIGLFMNSTWQTVYLVNCSYLVERVENDTDGNQIAILHFNQMALGFGDRVSYSVTYRIISKPRVLPNINEGESGTLNEITGIPKVYLSGGGTWLVNDSRLRTLVHSIAGNETKVLTIVENLVRWIKLNISYKVHEVPLYPNETYAWREGDCEDQAILLITLCRIIGIPAYLQIGCIYGTVYSSSGTDWEGHRTIVENNIGWHAWAMVYVPPWGWLPVDLTFEWQQSSEPLDAIKSAAVTSQSVIQYLNVIEWDYVTSDRQVKDFFETNDFYIYMQDEMIQVTTTAGGEWGGEWLIPAALTVGIIICLLVYYQIQRKMWPATLTFIN